MMARMAKRLSGRRIRIHRNYTVDEAARIVEVAKGTMLRWVRRGDLPALKDKRPYLILGSELRAFVDQRKIGRTKCRLHEAFCFTCRAPREPALGMADLRPRNSASAMLEALCSTCGQMMFKRVSQARISELRIHLDLTIKQAPPPLKEQS